MFLPTLVMSASADPATVADGPRLILAAVVAIVVIVVLITWLKLNPFLSLIVGSATLAGVAGAAPTELFTSFTVGFGSTLGGVGALVALGAIIGEVLTRTKGANAIVDKLLAAPSRRLLPWAVALVAFVIGIPLFFEIGVVLLVPIIMLIARRSNLPVMYIAMPALVALGEMHALLPPHPGPLALVQALGADLGLTMLFGFILAVPLTIIAGPLLAPVYARLAPVYAPAVGPGFDEAEETPGRRRPTVGVAAGVMLLPVVLMLGRTLAEIFLPEGNGVRSVLDFLGTPLTALVITALLALLVLGAANGYTRTELSSMVSRSFGPIAGILLIVGAGGGFKQTLVDLGVGTVVADATSVLAVSPLIIGWLLAALVRVATGSATVAALTAAGLAVSLADGMSTPELSLLVLAIGTGSGFLSHVNDAGFWLIKEVFGLTMGQTLKTWTLFTIIGPIVGLVLILGLDAVI
jgi:GntP family gluconate:H+ symporter